MPGKKDGKLIEKYCICCGLIYETNNSRTKYCSEECRKAVKRKAYDRDCKRIHKAYKPRTADKSISEIMRELADYNRKHNKSLSYGQYVARTKG